MNKLYIVSTTVLLTCCLLFVRSEVAAQGPAILTDQENDRIDSLKMSYDADEKRSQKFRDEENLSDLKSQKVSSRQEAKEAKRIERDANDAARESRAAYRTEKQAQKSRVQADKQARKAAKARKISDEN